MRVLDLDPLADERWDGYVDAHPDGSVYHHSAWLRVLLREFPRPVRALAVVDDDGRVRGVLPLVLTRGLPGLRRRPGFVPRLASLPRTPIAGPLGDDPAGIALLVRAAVERTPPRTQLQLKLPGPALEGLDVPVAGRPWRTSYVRELPARPEELRFGSARSSRGLKSRIVKARRAGVVVRDARSPEEVHRWYALYLATMRENAVPARPLRLFNAMWDELRPRGMMRLVVAEHDGGIVAGAVLLHHGATAFYAFGASAPEALTFSPMDLVQWTMIHDACAAGARRYDLGEVPEGNEGLARFKRKWGAEPERLHRYYHPPSTAPESAGYGDQGAALALAERAWQRVPLPLTAAVGAGVNRFL
jgi:hypothetical protein